MTRDGRVVTWGDNLEAADSRAVQWQLRHVAAVCSNLMVFAAVMGDAQ